MARNPKPVDQLKGHRSKDELEKLVVAQLLFNTTEKDKLKPPSYLDKVGKKRFKEIANEYNHLSNLDLDALVIYSQAYSQWVKRTKKMNTLDLDRNEEKDLQVLIDKSEKTMKDYGTKLSLFRVDRDKLANANADKLAVENDPLNNIFGGNDNEQDFIIP